MADDFGNKFSNIDRVLQLKNLYIIKVERNIWLEFPDLSKELIKIFKKRGIKTLAEKVETLDEFFHILPQGFDAVQGYLYKDEIIRIPLQCNLKESRR